MRLLPSALRRRLRTVSDVAATWREAKLLVRPRRSFLVLLGVASVGAGLAEASLVVLVVRAALAITEGDSTSLSVSFVDIEGVGAGVALWLAGGFALLTAVAQLGVAWAGARLAAAAESKLRENTYEDFIRASWPVQSAEVDGAFLTFVGTHVGKSSQAVSQLATTLEGILSFGAMLVVAAFVHPVAAIVLAVVGLALAALLEPLSAVARRFASRSAEAQREFNWSVLESVGLAMEFHSFDTVEPARSLMAQRIERIRGPQVVSLFLGTSLGKIYQTMVLLLVVAGLGLLYVTDVGATGSLGAVVLILMRGLQRSQRAQSAGQKVAESRPYLEELRERRERYRRGQRQFGLDTVDEFRCLEAHSVGYTYPGETEPALVNVSFCVNHLQTVGIIGPSGSGKSTLAQLLLRLREPTTGRVELNGGDIAAVSAEAFSRFIAPVPQDARLFNGTIRENIRFMRSWITDLDVEEAAKAAGVYDEIVGLPAGFETLVAERGARNVSGGQRQRISIARALAGKPSVLVLDEPTSALDAHSEGVIRDTMERLRSQVTIIVIAHKLSTLQGCDHIIVLAAGRVVEAGPPQQLLAEDGYFRRTLDAAAAAGE